MALKSKNVYLYGENRMNIKTHSLNVKRKGLDIIEKMYFCSRIYKLS